VCDVFQRRDRHVERQLELQSVPHIELTPNASSFAVYCGVRRSVLTTLMQQLSASLRRDVDTDSDAEDVDATKSSGDSTAARVPKVSSRWRHPQTAGVGGQGLLTNR